MKSTLSTILLFIGAISYETYAQSLVQQTGQQVVNLLGQDFNFSSYQIQDAANNYGIALSQIQLLSNDNSTLNAADLPYCLFFHLNQSATYLRSCNFFNPDFQLNASELYNINSGLINDQFLLAQPQQDNSSQPITNITTSVVDNGTGVSNTTVIQTNTTTPEQQQLNLAQLGPQFMIYNTWRLAVDYAQLFFENDMYAFLPEQLQMFLNGEQFNATQNATQGTGIQNATGALNQSEQFANTTLNETAPIIEQVPVSNITTNITSNITTNVTNATRRMLQDNTVSTSSTPEQDSTDTAQDIDQSILDRIEEEGNQTVNQAVDAATGRDQRDPPAMQNDPPVDQSDDATVDNSQGDQVEDIQASQNPVNQTISNTTEPVGGQPANQTVTDGGNTTTVVQNTTTVITNTTTVNNGSGSAPSEIDLSTLLPYYAAGWGIDQIAQNITDTIRPELQNLTGWKNSTENLTGWFNQSVINATQNLQSQFPNYDQTGLNYNRNVTDPIVDAVIGFLGLGLERIQGYQDDIVNTLGLSDATVVQQLWNSSLDHFPRFEQVFLPVQNKDQVSKLLLWCLFNNETESLRVMCPQTGLQALMNQSMDQNVTFFQDKLLSTGLTPVPFLSSNLYPDVLGTLFVAPVNQTNVTNETQPVNQTNVTNETQPVNQTQPAVNETLPVNTTAPINQTIIIDNSTQPIVNETQPAVNETQPANNTQPTEGQEQTGGVPLEQVSNTTVLNQTVVNGTR